jgi:hypothetical protein
MTFIPLGVFNFVKNLLKYKGIRSIFTVALTLALLYFGWLVAKFEYDSAHGKHVKLFGSERNIPKSDTVYVTGPAPDLLKQPKVTPNGPEISQKNKIGNNEVNNHSKVSQKNKNGKNEANHNSGTNNGQVGGEGNTQENKNHTVIGPNLGINGDLNVNSEPELSAVQLSYLFSRFDAFVASNNLPRNEITISLLDYSNAKKVYIQLVECFRSHGYNVTRSNDVMSAESPTMHKITVDTTGHQLTLFVGLFP